MAMTATELMARDQLGWSLAEAAEQLGITRRAYIYLEAGETSSGRKLKSIPRSYELPAPSSPGDMAAWPGAMVKIGAPSLYRRKIGALRPRSRQPTCEVVSAIAARRPSGLAA